MDWDRTSPSMQSGASSDTSSRGSRLSGAAARSGCSAGFRRSQSSLGGDFLIKEVDVVASFSYARWGALSEFQIALDGLAAGTFHGRQYISQRFPLDEIARAFEVAQHKDGQDAIKVSIVF